MLVLRYRSAAEALEDPKQRRAAYVPHIVLNVGTKVEAPLTPRSEVTQVLMTCSTTKERRGYQEKFPELAETQARMDDAPPADLETEHMDQSAMLLRTGTNERDIRLRTARDCLAYKNPSCRDPVRASLGDGETVLDDLNCFEPVPQQGR